MSGTSGDPRPRLDARVTAWWLEQRERQRALELERARLAGELAASERIERAGQRYADKLEEKLAEARRREASLARALGYAEAQRDQALARLGEGPLAALPRRARAHATADVDLDVQPAAEIHDVDLAPAPPPARRPRAAHGPARR